MTVDRIFELVAIVMASQGLWELVKHLISTRKTKRTASEDAELAILHEMIYPKLEECVLAQKVGLEEFERIDKLYQPYHRLGGNGTVERWYGMLINYPRYDDRKAKIDEE